MNQDPATREREPSFLDVDAETMRRVGYEVVDRVVHHLTRMEEEPVWRMLPRPEGERLLREPVPESGASMEELIPTLEHDVLAHAGRIGHPRFFAFVPSAVTFPGLMGELLANAYNLFVGTWVGGSGPSMLELVVLEWIREMLGLPEGTGGLLTSGGSSAMVMAVVTARDARLDNRTDGAVIYASEQTHSSAERAAWIAGFPREAFRYLPTGSDYRLDAEVLRDAIREDREAKRKPFLLVGNAGSTNTGSVDPLEELAGVCRDEGLWFHVDAAYGGFAAITERGRATLAGLDAADSWVLDPHKWLYQGYECGSLLVRRPQELQKAFHFTADYMQDVELGEERPNFCDSGLQLSRSARAIKVWLSLKHLGLDAFRRAVDRTLDLTLLAEEVLESDPEFEVLSPARLGVVCFRYRSPGGKAGDLDEQNREICSRLNEGGYAFLSSTKLRGRFSLRFCILSHRTTEADVRGVIDRIRELGRAVAAGDRG
jgi:glutamate/tyrosine decarboxylase-like PLP-dependent enzyme